MLRFIGRGLAWLGAAALLCLLCSGLVTTSVRAEETPQEQPVPVQADLRCDADLPVPQPAAAVQEQQRTGAEKSVAVPQLREAPKPVLCDANGCPLTGSTWVRAAWIANPPESIPGS